MPKRTWLQTPSDTRMFFIHTIYNIWTNHFTQVSLARELISYQYTCLLLWTTPYNKRFLKDTDPLKIGVFIAICRQLRYCKPSSIAFTWLRFRNDGDANTKANLGILIETTRSHSTGLLFGLGEHCFGAECHPPIWLDILIVLNLNICGYEIN